MGDLSVLQHMIVGFIGLNVTLAVVYAIQRIVAKIRRAETPE